MDKMSEQNARDETIPSKLNLEKLDAEELLEQIELAKESIQGPGLKICKKVWKFGNYSENSIFQPWKIAL